MAIDPARVILKDENFDAPKDQALYVLIEYEGDSPIGVGSHVNATTGIETSHYAQFTNWAIEVCSRNRDASDRYPEVLMALRSITGQQAAEIAQCSFFYGNPLNLSAIEGSAALRRWHIPVIVSNVQKKTSTAAMIDKFPPIVPVVEA
jgi:hypothetical protein